MSLALSVMRLTNVAGIILWGDTIEERKVHTVSWQKICRPKEWGGLGLRSVRHINQTVLMKAGWQIMTGQEDLWVKSMRAKYRCGSDLIPKIKRNLNGSNFWIGVRNTWPVVEDNVAWRVGNGKSICWWKDNWVPKMGKLCDVALRPLNDADLFKRVSSCGTVSGSWDLQGVREFLPQTVIHRIMSMPGPCAGRGDDRVAWKCTADGCFTNALAYEALLDLSLKDTDMPYKWIWRWQGPERVRSHLWKLAHEALITNSWRAKRHLVESNCCPVCGTVEESVLHVVRDCPRMIQVWRSLCNDILPHTSFFTDDMAAWLRINLQSTTQRKGLNWPLLFGTSVHLAWQARNELIFHQKSLSIAQLVCRIMCQAADYNSSLNDHRKVNPLGGGESLR